MRKFLFFASSVISISVTAFSILHKEFPDTFLKGRMAMSFCGDADTIAGDMQKDIKMNTSSCFMFLQFRIIEEISLNLIFILLYIRSVFQYKLLL
jgi:hypothetical protein